MNIELINKNILNSICCPESSIPHPPSSVIHFPSTINFTPVIDWAKNSLTLFGF